MSRQKHNDDNPSPNDGISKAQQKKEASSIDRAHILSVLSKCKILKETNDGFSQKIESCLRDLDAIKETSLILQALKFSNHVTICLDPNASDLSTIAKSDALGWFNYQEGELLIGAMELTTERKNFMGVFAHELTHWCMQVVFKNNCLPYFQSDPNRVKEEEFEAIVNSVEDLNSKNTLDCVISSVFRDYKEDKWHQELIVRVPHLIAQNGVQDATEILGRHQPTTDLLEFYRLYVMTELWKFIAGGDLEKSRETVIKLNGKLGLLQFYRKYEFKFRTRVDTDSQETTSLLVYSSPHPYVSFLKIAWSRNCEETTELFYCNNVFCDFDAFAKNSSDVISIFHKLDECKTLFIVCPELKNETSYSYKHLFGRLEEVLALKSQKKAILIVSNKMMGLMKKQLEGISSINSKCISMKKIEFADLLEESQELVLDATITVQGRKVELNEVLEEEEFQLCDGNLIEKLLRAEDPRDKVMVGNRKISHRDSPASFVSFYENLKIQRLLDLIRECTDDGNVLKLALILVGELENYPDCLKKILCGIFGCDDLNEISITSADALLDRDSQKKSPYPILLFASEGELEHTRLVSNYREFQRYEVCYFVKVVSQKVIYCDLMHYPDLVFLRQLVMTKAGLLKKVDGGSDQSIGQDDFIKNIVFGTDTVNIISDSAGAGKSQFLNLIYNSTTQCWVMKCSLKSCVSFIDEHTLAADLDKEDAMSFILKMGRIDDPFAENLLDFKMTTASQFPVVLLLDGMDEMTSSDRNSAYKNKEKIVHLIQFLKEQTSLIVVIATRPESESVLSQLSCPIYEFTEISLEESKAYLINLCIARSHLFSKPTSPQESVNALVQKYIGGNLLDTHVSQDFLKIPLHVSMLSEIIVESMKDGSFNSNIVDSNGKLIPDKLYSEFIDNKYRIYFKEKQNIAVDDRLKENCNSAFQMLAFFSLFGREGINVNYFSKNGLFRCEMTGKVNLNYDKVALYFDIGLISSAPDADVDFVHQTFAEYFVSRLFISWAQDESMYERLIVDVIYQPHRTSSFFESSFKQTSFSDEITKRHGDFMASLDVVKAVYALRYHMWFDRLNIVDYIFKCWKRVGKFHVFLDPKTYKKDSRDYPLFFASTMSSDRILERVLQEDFDINYKTTGHHYVISSLFKRGNVPLLKGLRDNGLLTEHVMKNAGNSLVHDAAASGKIDLVEWLESLGYDIFQETTINHAIFGGNLEMVKWFKNRGVSISFRSEWFEETAVHTAVKYRQFHIVKWLVDEGLDINGGDEYGTTPLQNAATDGRSDMVRCLVDAGADVHACSENGWNALHYAASGNVPSLETFKLLVEHGSRVDEKTPKGCSAVHLALKYIYNDTSVVEWLLDETKDIQATDVEGRGYVHYAAANDRQFHFSVLLLKNCDVHLRDETNQTAAHVAIDTMRSLDDSIDLQYSRLMVDPFKLLVLKMMETHESVLEELVSYANEVAKNESSSILESAIRWMDAYRPDCAEGTHLCT